MRNKKCFNFFFFIDHKKFKKPPQKVAYLVHLGVFKSLHCSPDCRPTAQTSPELQIRFINSSIQSSLLRSLPLALLWKSKRFDPIDIITYSPSKTMLKDLFYSRTQIASNKICDCLSNRVIS